jgi:hypothetical protein
MNNPTTKEKLASIVNGFEDFDTEMKIGTRVGFTISYLFFMF